MTVLFVRSSASKQESNNGNVGSGWSSAVWLFSWQWSIFSLSGCTSGHWFLSSGSISIEIDSGDLVWPELISRIAISLWASSCWAKSAGWLINPAETHKLCILKMAYLPDIISLLRTHSDISSLSFCKPWRFSILITCASNCKQTAGANWFRLWMYDGGTLMSWYNGYA